LTLINDCFDSPSLTARALIYVVIGSPGRLIIMLAQRQFSDRRPAEWVEISSASPWTTRIARTGVNDDELAPVPVNRTLRKNATYESNFRKINNTKNL